MVLTERATSLGLICHEAPKRFLMGLKPCRVHAVPRDSRNRVHKWNCPACDFELEPA